MKRQDGMSEAGAVGVLVIIVMLAVGALMTIVPLWNVWRAGLQGEAELSRAEQSKKVMIETARAERDAAALRAEAIATMGAAAKAYPEYRQQEFVQAFGEALRDGRIQQIIYVPTEANIPITEAGRR